ncbi:MAG: cell division FtsA domain-containing protein, partial [Oscillospiraceae bacterium]
QNMSFYCVGNSIIRQTLDGYEYNNLNEHKGNNISIEVIATFLPGSVVESLYAVIEGCNMEISHMTLEPIAAMNALIPKDLRALNLALVDIGAGTSDIAVSKAGTILSYEMVTTAGDEITDSIVSSLLVDFDTAERLKRELSTGKNEFPYEDILKFQHEITREELLTIVGEAVEKMCSEICDTILKVNGAAPAAVFLVGGGSQIPDLTGRVAQKLGIPENKVALGNTPYFREMKNEAKNLVGPEFMTPLGIVITSFTEKKTKPKTVLLNGDAIKIFDEKNLTVTSVLISAGIPLRSLVGTPGQSIHFKLNGEERVLRGSVSIPSQITVNGEGAAVTTACKTNDVINIIFPENGITPIVTIGAYLKNPPESFVYYKEKQIRIGTVVKRSGEIVP